jgi:hypothetical protein
MPEPYEHVGEIATGDGGGIRRQRGFGKEAIRIGSRTMATSSTAPSASTSVGRVARMMKASAAAPIVASAASTPAAIVSTVLLRWSVSAAAAAALTVKVTTFIATAAVGGQGLIHRSVA